MSGRMESWAVHERNGGAGELHLADLPPGRGVWLMNVNRPAVVLGSTQKMSDIDPATAGELGLEVAVRRSGGGLVWLDPADTTWVDVTIPAGDPLWVEDVPRSMMWLGRVFTRVFGAEPGIRVVDSPYDAGEHGRSLCFAGTAPGEVMTDAGKLVGISQRRGRNGARFQCVVHHTWSPERFASVFADPAVTDAAARLPVATTGMDRAAIVAALVENLRG